MSRCRLKKFIGRSDLSVRSCRGFFLYIVQSFTDRDMDIETYTECHKIIGAAWRRMNDDSEFCEQLELDLPTPTLTMGSAAAAAALWGVGTLSGPAVY